MRLQFDGLAIVESRGRCVNFVGHYRDDGMRQHDVLCRVDREVLERLGGLSNPAPEDLLTAYHQLSDKLNPIASAQYAAGIGSPYITTCDMPQEWSSSERAA